MYNRVQLTKIFRYGDVTYAVAELYLLQLLDRGKVIYAGMYVGMFADFFYRESS